MGLYNLLHLITLFVTIFAKSSPFLQTSKRGCGSQITQDQVSTYETHFQNELATKGLTLDHFTRPKLNSDYRVSNTTLTFRPIKVYWHVIYASKKIEDGYLPLCQIENSIAAMNSHHNNTGISFKLAKVTRTKNETWFYDVSPYNELQTEMKNKLRRGQMYDLNVYSVGFGGSTDPSGLLGYSTFPMDYNNNPKDDGVVILHSTVPGGSTDYYNQGKTLTHECGHWLGLYHVFQGGCDAEGDQVSDTPPQSIATLGCPQTQDSCPGSGLDSIHNYMDYSYDDCMNEFTEGQAARMGAQIQIYRGINITSSISQ